VSRRGVREFSEACCVKVLQGGGVVRSERSLPVSVVTCAFNAELHLRDAAESILEQTHRDLELLIIDDGSTDSTRKIIEEIARSDSRVRFTLLPENQGIAFARQLGLEQAKNDWMLFFDADDVAFPEMVEAQVRAVQSDSSLLGVGVFAYHVRARFAPDRSSTERNRPVGRTELRLGPPSKAAFDQTWKRENLILLLAPVLFPRHRALAAGGYRQAEEFADVVDVRMQDVMEDIDLWCRIADLRKDGEYMVVLPEPLFYRRRAVGSLTSRSVLHSQRKGRWLKDCLERRRRGLPERSVTELEASYSGLGRLDLLRRDYAALWFTKSGQAYVEQKLARAGLCLLVAGIFSPRYLFKRLRVVGGKLEAFKLEAWCRREVPD
jgi:glycosyltransferase involved in cell wall biosynthesis